MGPQSFYEYFVNEDLWEGALVGFRNQGQTWSVSDGSLLPQEATGRLTRGWHVLFV